MIQQPLMTLCVFAIIPVMAWLTVLFNGRWDKVWQKNRHNQSEINAQVEDTLSGIRVVKSFANEDIEQQKFDRGNKELVKSKSEVYHYMGVFSRRSEAWTRLCTSLYLYSADCSR